MRRVFLAGLAMVIVLGFSGTGQAGDHGRACTPAGTWTMKVDFNFIPDPGNPSETIKFYLQNLQSFTADGRTTSVLPTGAGHPNVGDTRIACLGEWRWSRPDRGRCEFQVIQHCLYNQAWDGIYGEIVGKGSVSKDGKHLTLNFSYIDYNGDGTLNYDQGTGVSNGTRLGFPSAE